MPRIPYEVKPGDGCPGMHTLNGRTLGLCLTCTRLGGKELEAMAHTRAGHTTCVNHHPLADGQLYPRTVSRDASVGAVEGEVGAVQHTPNSGQPCGAAQTAQVGGPEEGAACGGAQSDGSGVCS